MTRIDQIGLMKLHVWLIYEEEERIDVAGDDEIRLEVLELENENDLFTALDIFLYIS